MAATEAQQARLACELRRACEDGGAEALRGCVQRWGLIETRRLPGGDRLPRLAVRTQLMRPERWPELQLLALVCEEGWADAHDLLSALIEETGGVLPFLGGRREVARIVAWLLPRAPGRLGQGGALLPMMAARGDAWAVLAAAPQAEAHLISLLRHLPDHAPLSRAAWEWGLVFAGECSPQVLDHYAGFYCGERAKRHPPEDFNHTKGNLLRAALHAAAVHAVSVN